MLREFLVIDMNKKKIKMFVLVGLLIISCFMISGCNIQKLLKKTIINEIENRYIEYSQNITVEDIEQALISFDSGILLNVATFCEEELNIGQYAIAVGSPYDIESFYNTVTIGAISCPQRMIQEEDLNGKMVNNTFVQHDAAINSGNSGGGLYDIYGRLIGINTWKLVGDPGDNFEGLNFAIPSTVVYTTFESYLKND